MKILQKLFNRQQPAPIVEPTKPVEKEKFEYIGGLFDDLMEQKDNDQTQEYNMWFKEQLALVKESLKVKKTDAVMAMDNVPANVMDGEYYSNESYNLSNRLIQDNMMLGFAQLSLLVQVPIIGNACRGYADEMLRAGWEFYCDDENVVEATDVLQKLKQIFDQEELQKTIRDAMIKTQQLGGIAVYPKFKDDKPDNRTKPLKINNDTIAVGSLLGYSIIEPIWCTPTFVNYSDPFELDFYKPTKYNVMGVETDVSRLIIVVTEELPNILKPIYRHYGISLTQKLIKAVSQFNNVRDEIEKIIARFNLTVFKVPIGVSNSDKKKLTTRIKDFIKGRNNFGILAVDKESEDIVQLTMALNGLNELLSRYAEIMCIEIQEPATKLLGISPQGFSTNDESGHRNWNDLTAGNQNRILKPFLMQLVKLELLNIGVDMSIIEKIKIRFNKLMESNKKEDAEIAEINSRTAMNNINAGLTSQEEERQVLIDAPDSYYSELDPDEAIEQPMIESKEPTKTNKKNDKK
jgi:phage-related protein (TIGR01555 family)